MALGDWQKAALIRNHPCFAKLNNKEVEELASLAIDKYLLAGQNIVTEGEPVDSVYLIEEGEAEVRHISQEGNKTIITPLAILSPGEGIGISDIGLYSKTGKRTATVVALSDIILIQIDLQNFNKFLNDRPTLTETLRDDTETMSRVNFIKQTASFAKLPPEKISWLCDQVKSISVEAGKILFNKDDYTDQCCFILKGEVEIFIPLTSGTEKRVAVLHEKMIFGETSLLMNLPSHISARTLTECDLLVINQHIFKQAIPTEQNVEKSLMELMRSQSHPTRLSYIESYIAQGSDQETIVTLQDTKNQEYYKLNQEGFFIWQLLDGKHTLRDITIAFYQEFSLFDPGLIANLLIDLEQKGFISKNPGKSKESKLMSFIHQETLYNLNNPDAFLTKLFDKCFYVFYTIPLQLLLLALTIIGLVVFVKKFNSHVTLLDANTGYFVLMLIVALALFLIRRILHALAHGLTIKAMHHKVNSFSIVFSWLGPVALCDQSDIWISRKRAQIPVDLSGVYMDMLLGGLASIITLYLLNPFIVISLWLFSLFCYVATLFQLSPLTKSDGYYAVVDLFRRKRKGKVSVRESREKTGFFYWVFGLLYTAIEVYVIYWLTNIYFNLFSDFQNNLLSLGISLIIVAVITKLRLAI